MTADIIEVRTLDIGIEKHLSELVIYNVGCMDTGVILIFNTGRVDQSLHHLVRKDMDVKEHKRLSNITHRHKLK